MPVLMVALVALAAFGLIGVLLATAVFLEQHSKKKQQEIGPAIISGAKRSL